MMKITRNDIILLITPFLLTAVFLVLGYQILVSTTPEARISPPVESEAVEIITDGNIEIITPQSEIPEKITATIQPIPQTTAQLNQVFAYLNKPEINAVYFSVPLDYNSDNTLVLANADQSSQENIMRWAKRSISAVHQKNAHVFIALTINASTTITDPASFALNLSDIVEQWASLATEYSVSFFSPGVTLQHPLYSSLNDKDFNKITATLEARIRKNFQGPMGLGFCCSDATSLSTGGYNFITLIPTPEYGFNQLEPAALKLQNTKNLTRIFYYNRDQSIVTSYHF